MSELYSQTMVQFYLNLCDYFFNSIILILHVLKTHLQTLIEL
jgi:hypothetical protein